MTRTTFAAALLLVAVLALASPRSAVAGPPESPVGAMKLDKVADDLRQYQQSKTDDKRVEWLNRLAPSHDPRVKAALEAALSDRSAAIAEAAGDLLAQHFGQTPSIPDLPPIPPLPPAAALLRPPVPAPPPRSGPPET